MSLTHAHVRPAGKAVNKTSSKEKAKLLQEGKLAQRAKKIALSAEATFGDKFKLIVDTVNTDKGPVHIYKQESSDEVNPSLWFMLGSLDMSIMQYKDVYNDAFQGLEEAICLPPHIPIDEVEVSVGEFLASTSRQNQVVAECERVRTSCHPKIVDQMWSELDVKSRRCDEEIVTAKAKIIEYRQYCKPEYDKCLDEYKNVTASDIMQLCQLENEGNDLYSKWLRKIATITTPPTRKPKIHVKSTHDSTTCAKCIQLGIKKLSKPNGI